MNIQGLLVGSHITLMDAKGKNFAEAIATSTSQSMDISTFAKGIYIVSVVTADGKNTNVKVVKN